MTKLTLVFAPPSVDYKDVVWSVKDAPSPPQTNIPELGAYVKHYASKPVEIRGIVPQVMEQGRFRYYTVEEIAGLCYDSEIVGLTCLYHNQERALEIAKAVKFIDPKKKVVLGGPNVSNRFMAKTIFNRNEAVDYIVIGDGEEALLGLVENKCLEDIPNLAYKNKGEVKFTRREDVDLNKIPQWDYRDIIEAERILEAHDCRTEKYQELTKRYWGRTLGEIAVFSRRGCAKVSGIVGNHKGPCKFCTSCGSSYGKMNPDNFWRQVELLYHEYGIQDYFLADNIFGIDLNQLQQFKRAREIFDIPNSVQFRAYTYPEIIIGKDGQEIAKHLRELGINNIFLGVETFDAKVSLLANKDPAPYKVVERAIQILNEKNIDVFVSFMPGLPGETVNSLQTNLDCLEKLLKGYSSKEYGKGHLTRVDISPAMPLVGTAWHNQLINNQNIQNEYEKITGRRLNRDITPNFDVLRALSLRYYAQVGAKEVMEFEKKAKQMCLEYMKPEMLGGFDLRNNFDK